MLKWAHKKQVEDRIMLEEMINAIKSRTPCPGRKYFLSRKYLKQNKITENNNEKSGEDGDHGTSCSYCGQPLHHDTAETALLGDLMVHPSCLFIHSTLTGSSLKYKDAETQTEPCYKG